MRDTQRIDRERASQRDFPSFIPPFLVTSWKPSFDAFFYPQTFIWILSSHSDLRYSVKIPSIKALAQSHVLQKELLYSRRILFLNHSSFEASCLAFKISSLIQCLFKLPVKRVKGHFLAFFFPIFDKHHFLLFRPVMKVGCQCVENSLI